jgi:hypothetical protein
MVHGDFGEEIVVRIFLVDTINITTHVDLRHSICSCISK